MARGMSRGEIWMYSFPKPDKRRPVLILSRREVIELLHTVMVAPITSAMRGAPSEVRVGTDEGLKHESVVNLDHVQTVVKNRLSSFLGTVPPRKMRAVCAALAIATGCEA